MTGGGRGPVNARGALVQPPAPCLDGAVQIGEQDEEASTLLTITPDASSVIRRVSAHPTLGPGSGLRIASRTDPDAALEVAIAPGPRPGDRVVEQDGGRLFLTPSAAERVSGRELDATTDAGGRVHFVARRAA